MSDEEFRLDNPMLVRWEFASEERLEKRNALYKRLTHGINPEDVLFDAIKEFAPTRVVRPLSGHRRAVNALTAAPAKP